MKTFERCGLLCDFSCIKLMLCVVVLLLNTSVHTGPEREQGERT